MILAAGCGGLFAAGFFALWTGAAAVVAIGTAGPGYFPAFMDPALQKPLPAGPVPGLLIGILLLQLGLSFTRRWFYGENYGVALGKLLAAPIAFLLWATMPLVPLYAQRLVFVAGFALYFAIAARFFAREIRITVNFFRDRWLRFALILLGVMLLVQLYLAFFAPHDYAAYVASNQLDNKYKRNLMRGGFALTGLGWGLYALFLFWRRRASPAADEPRRRSRFAIRLRRLFARPFRVVKGRPAELSGPGAVALLLGEGIALTLVLLSFLALPDYTPLAWIDGSAPFPWGSLLMAAGGVLIGLGLVLARAGIATAARRLRFAFWLAPLLILNLPFFEYRSETLTIALLTLGALLTAREARGLRLDHAWLVRGALALFAAAFVLFIVSAATGAIQRFHAFLPLNLDLTVEHQALWTLSFHGYPFLSIGAKDGIYDRIYWPDHVPFFYYILAPVYRLAPRVETLLILQTVFIAAGAVPVFLLMRRLLQSTLAGAIGGLLYLLHPGFQLLSQWDVHEGAFAAAIFLFALYFYEARRPALFLLLLGLGGFVREEMGLFGVSVGLMLILTRRDVRYGSLALILGACQFVLMSKVMQAYFGGLGHYERYYPLFFLENTYNVQNILYLLLWNPLYFFRNWWDSEKLVFLLLILAPFGFAPLLGLLRWRWTVLLAGLASTLLAVRVPNYTPGYQYSILLLVGCFYLMPHGLRQILRVAPGQRNVLFTFLLSMALGSGYLYGALFGKTHAISFMGEWNPDRGQIEWNGWIARSFHPPEPTPAHEQLRALLRHVPSDAAVAAPERISTHLSGRAKNYTLPRIDDARYVVSHVDFEQNPSIEAIATRDDFELWKRSEDGKSFIFRRVEPDN